MTDKKERLREIFEDTQAFYETDPFLEYRVGVSRKSTRLFGPGLVPQLPEPHDRPAYVCVTRRKSFEAAMRQHAVHPRWRITVLNFASATRPGGGVKNGSSAQEESLCRCSTLYPTLDQRWLWQQFYDVNRALHDNRHTDACIYSPGVVICKTDEAFPQRLDQEDWVTVDIISCAAPNLREIPGNMYNVDRGPSIRLSYAEQVDMHVQRARHILQVAAACRTDFLILGAFGCGAFQNDPGAVAEAYRKALPDFLPYFEEVEFAVYCRGSETENYEAFRRAFNA